MGFFQKLGGGRKKEAKKAQDKEATAAQSVAASLVKTPRASKGEMVNREKLIIIAVAAILIVGCVAVLTLGVKPPAPPLPGEEKIFDALGNELNSMPDVNTSELENLLKTMVG